MPIENAGKSHYLLTRLLTFDENVYVKTMSGIASILLSFCSAAAI